MADIELVIKINENAWKRICDSQSVPDMLNINIVNGLNAIKNGTPLPKGHGRLFDMDELVKNILKEYGVNSIHELPQDIKMFYDKFINSAPTILDATFDYKLKNYAFFRKEEEK